MGSTRSSRAVEVAARQRRAHWERIYRSNPDKDLSWTQREPGVSFELIRESATTDARVLDVGGGASALAARLALAGYRHVTVLDVSATALERGRRREPPGGPRVVRRRGDVLGADGLGRADVWHDRALFHFLTRAADRSRYVAAARRAVPPGGCAVIGTFAPDGPARCSGLRVRRYGVAGLAREFTPAFRLERTVREDHVTPWGAHQALTYVVLRRTEASDLPSLGSR